jgi:hypothetical protein
MANVELSKYWMPPLRDLKEFKEIAKAEEPEIRLLLEAMDRALNNLYIESADEYGIQRFEKLLSLYPEAEDTLEERRFRVQTKWNDQIPYTEMELKDRLNSLCGAGGYSLEISYSEYKLAVLVALKNKALLPMVSDLLDRLVPCNMVVTLDLMYNIYDWLTKATYGGLSTYTYEELKSETIKEG